MKDTKGTTSSTHAASNKSPYPFLVGRSQLCKKKQWWTFRMLEVACLPAVVPPGEVMSFLITAGWFPACSKYETDPFTVCWTIAIEAKQTKHEPEIEWALLVSRRTTGEGWVMGNSVHWKITAYFLSRDRLEKHRQCKLTSSLKSINKDHTVDSTFDHRDRKSVV